MMRRSISHTGRAVSVVYIQVIVDVLLATFQVAKNISERNSKQGVVSPNQEKSPEKQPPREEEPQHAVRSVIDEDQRLSDEQKIEINKKILQSGGILRDYDNNEILYPMNLAVLNVLQTMLKDAQDAL